VAALVVVHDLGKRPRKTVSPQCDGNDLVTTHGYVHRKVVVISWAETAEIESNIVSNETGGFSRDGDYRAYPAIAREFPLYNVEANLVKYTDT